MKARISNYLRGLSVLCSDVALCCLTLAMVSLVSERQIAMPILIWLGVLCLQFIINDGMMSFGVPMNGYLVFNGAAVAAAGFLVYRYTGGRMSGDLSLLMVLSAVVITGVHCGRIAWKLPGSNGILIYVDILIVMLGFYLYTAFYSGWQEDTTLVALALAAMAADLVVVNHLRTGDECDRVIYGAGAGGRVMMFLILAGCMVLTGLAAGLMSGQVHSVVDLILAVCKWCWNVVATIMGAIGGAIGAVINYLISLLPDAPQTGQENQQAAVNVTEEVVEATARVLPEWVGYVLLAAALLTMVGLAMYQFRNVTMKREKRIHRIHRAVRKSHFFPAVAAGWKQIVENLRFEWNYRRFRKTPQGLLVLAERSCRSKKLKRQKWESPGQYMRRLDQILRSQENESRLDELAEMLDKVFYGGQARCLTSDEYRLFAKQIQSVKFQ